MKELEKKEDSVCLHGRATCKGWNVVKTSLYLLQVKRVFFYVSVSLGGVVLEWRRRKI